MTKVKHILAPSSATVSITDGQLLFQSDRGKLYVDFNGSRIAITDVEYASSYPVAPISDRLYVTSTGARLYHGSSYVEWAALDSNGKVPHAAVPVAGNTEETIGGVYTGVAYGLAMSNGRLQIQRADETAIDGVANNYRPIVPSKLRYAVRSVSPLITEIPSATSAYSLLDASATTNNHSNSYRHTPVLAPTYTLPAVTDTAIEHSIELEVSFLAYSRSSTDDGTGYYAWKNGTILLYTNTSTPVIGTTVVYSDTSLTESAGTVALFDNSTIGKISLVGSVVFQDSNEATIAPVDEIDIESGDIIHYYCSYDASQSQWRVFAMPMNRSLIGSMPSSPSPSPSPSGGLSKDEVFKMAFVFG